MLFVDIEFPRRIAIGAQTAPGWHTELAQTTAGFETAIQRWANARHAYDVSFAVRTNADFREVLTHFHQVRGRGRSFPFKDARDYRVAQSEGVLIAAGGSPKEYQLVKRYGTGANAWDRIITRPSSQPVVYRTRSGSTTNATADADVSVSDGRVLMDNHVAGDTYAWAGQFFVPCRYDTDSLPSAAINRQPGDDGDLLIQCESIPIVEVREQ